MGLGFRAFDDFTAEAIRSLAPALIVIVLVTRSQTPLLLYILSRLLVLRHGAMSLAYILQLTLGCHCSSMLMLSWVDGQLAMK